MPALRRTRLRSTIAALAAGIAGALALSTGLASAGVDYTAPMTDPIEQSLSIKTVADKLGAPAWDIAELAAGGKLYKGMDVVCSKILPSADINNRFAQTPSWFGDPATANDYAIRATVRAYRRTQRVVPDRLDAYDPEAATVAEYQATRPLRLLILIDRANIENLLGLIKAAIDRQLATGIGAYIAGGAWYAGADEPADLLDALHLLARPDHRAQVDAYISDHGDTPLGLSRAELDYLRAGLVRDGWSDDDARRRAARSNRRAAGKIVDDLIALEREHFIVRFATGYGMTWDDQKKVLGTAQVAHRGLTGVTGFPLKDVYSLKLPGQPAAFAAIGPGKDEFNRISQMGKDLELVAILRKYVNVDGYWAPQVPSLWHRDGKFHSEVALVYPRQAVEFTGKCLEPVRSTTITSSDLDDDD